ncbi:cytochrome P450 2C5-like [Rhineura floridana]|uniref:cytochrome P450 2C5-like n=1 Tax=Rhineura floridana TaxID=261503 RepID=UPI002AC82AC2|nr:cytochrome P450 2C5-like [Rhineura floridana]
MELVTGAGVLLVLFVLTIMSFKLYKARGRLPPGPTPWIFLGNLLQKDTLPLHETFPKLTEKYGPVFTLWLGPKPMVVLCGYDAVKDALVDHGEEFGGRPSIPIFEKVSKGYGLINPDDTKWKELRRFTLSTLRNFGMGKKPMAERIQEEARCLVEAMTTSQGQAFDAMPDITAAASNVICSVVFGNRFSYEDPHFTELLRIITDFVGFFVCVSGVVYNAIPRIMNFLPGPHNKLFSDSAKICTFIREKVESHKLSLDPQNPDDFIDCFLLRLNKEQNSAQKICTEDLVMTVLTLFIAGTETTSTNLMYGLLLLARFPHIQAKVQQEIDEVVGVNRSPGMEDRVRMNYTNAVIHEIQRYQRGSSETFPHVTTQDVDLMGYTIPQGTLVVPLFLSVHFDPAHWEAPEKFDPGHFLDEEGEFRKRDAFVPFSAGKRSCPGEALAQMELFLFFCTLLQNFTFQVVANPEEVDIDAMFLNCREKGKHRQLRAIRRKI